MEYPGIATYQPASWSTGTRSDELSRRLLANADSSAAIVRMEENPGFATVTVPLT
jgi:hypothetical protein